MGTVYQKRNGTQSDLVAGTFIQYSAAATFFAVGAFAFETREVVWAQPLIWSMVWLVFGVSIGAILLLMWHIPLILLPGLVLMSKLIMERRKDQPLL